MLVPIDPRYIGDLEAIDEEAYGPGVYDWWHPFEHVAVMMYPQAQGFLSYKITGEIEKLAVRESMRRMGIGTEMMRWLINRAQRKRIQTLKLTLHETNITGALFLASCGFDSRLRGEMIVFTRKVIL